MNAITLGGRSTSSILHHLKLPEVPTEYAAVTVSGVMLSYTSLNPDLNAEAIIDPSLNMGKAPSTSPLFHSW